MIRPPPRATLTDTLVPYTTLSRSLGSQLTRRLDVVAELEPVLPGAHDGRELGVPLVELLGQSLVSVGLRLREPLFHICVLGREPRSEEHTSDLQSLMRISYAVFCLKKQQIMQPRS